MKSNFIRCILSSLQQESALFTVAEEVDHQLEDNKQVPMHTERLMNQQPGRLSDILENRKKSIKAARQTRIIYRHHSDANMIVEVSDLHQIVNAQKAVPNENSETSKITIATTPGRNTMSKLP